MSPPYIYRPITTEKEINNARNAMVATGKFGYGMSDCEVVGINGDCGPDSCPVYLIDDGCSYLEEDNLEENEHLLCGGSSTRLIEKEKGNEY